MKKIAGILAVAAMATSMFAADISAGTKIKGTVLSYGEKEYGEGNEKVKLDTFSLLGQGNDSHDYANPNFTMSISDDKAGATVKITTDGGNLNAAQTTQTIWFKPIDALKVTVGNYDVALNKETIDWTESWTGLGGNGFLFSVNVSGVSVDLGLNEGNNGAMWFTKVDKVDDPDMKELFAKVGYSADFGSIGAYVMMNRKVNSWDAYAKNYGVNPMKGAISNIDFGAGYKNTFDPITLFVNVIGHMEDKFEWVRPEVFVTGNVDAFGFSAFAAPLIFVDGDLNRDAECEVVAKVTYRLDACTPYVYFKDANLMNKTFVSTIKVGATGNCGLMGWNIWAQIDTNDKVSFSIPVEFTVNF